VSGLWRDNPATPAQRQLAFRPNRKRNPKPTQADVLLSLLRKARTEGKALTLPEILQTGIAQFTARIFELRERGLVIENELQRADGRVLSRYWLRHDPEQDGAQ
jgi:Helix-turn-helix domain